MHLWQLEFDASASSGLTRDGGLRDLGADEGAARWLGNEVALRDEIFERGKNGVSVHPQGLGERSRGWDQDAWPESPATNVRDQRRGDLPHECWSSARRPSNTGRRVEGAAEVKASFHDQMTLSRGASAALPGLIDLLKLDLSNRPYGFHDPAHEDHAPQGAPSRRRFGV